MLENVTPQNCQPCDCILVPQFACRYNHESYCCSDNSNRPNCPGHISKLRRSVQDTQWGKSLRIATTVSSTKTSLAKWGWRRCFLLKKKRKTRQNEVLFILTQIGVLEFTSYKGEAVTSSWKYLRLLRESHSWEILGAYMLEGFESNFHFFRVLKNLKGFLKEIHKTDSTWELNFPFSN